jgi:hypothetical protein
MRVICTDDSASGLSPGVLSRSLELPTARFALIIGREYAVYGMLLSVRGLYILVVNHRPNWYLIDLFDVIDRSIPNS